jgi:hypothetical protein
MDLMRARVALRERPLLDVLDLAVRFCAANARAYAKMSLAVVVPAFVVSWAAGQFVGWWLGWMVAVVLSCFAGAPFVALASRLVFAESVGTRQALGLAARAVPRLVVVRLLQLLALAASGLVVGLPWIWLGTIFLFVVEVAVLEQTGVGAVLGRTQRIAHAHFPNALLAMILGTLAPLAAAMLADVAGRDVLGSVLEIKPPLSMFKAGGSWLALLGWWGTLPLIQTTRFFVYLDIRTRTEGWDIQTRFAALAAREEEDGRREAELAHPAASAARATRRRAITAAVAILTLTTVARPAQAILDPTRAQADADMAMHDGSYSFCREPRTPLSLHARELCPHATEIPDCAGFAAECAKTMTPPTPPSWLAWLSRLSLPGFLGSLAQILLWALVAVLVAAVLVPIVAAIARTRSEREAKGEAKAPRTPAAEAPRVELPNVTDPQLLLARADELARQGRLALALQAYLLAALRALDQRGAVRVAKDRTNGEYVRACADAAAKPALRDIVREVDHVQFGGQEPTADGVVRAAQRAVAIVRSPAGVLLLALVLGAGLGCGGSSMKLPRPGDDPAGSELLRDVLGRQGVHLLPLDSALASLPLPAPGERAPAVVIDLERTALDDDTRDHLVDWVEAGGVLVLASSPMGWPKELGGAPAGSGAASHKITVRRLLARSPPVDPDEEEEDSDEAGGEDAIYAPSNEVGMLAGGAGLTLPSLVTRVAWFDDGTLYAGVTRLGSGYVLGIATDELMTNAGLARPGNAAAMVAILSHADRLEVRFADTDDGVSPPATPIAALLRAGLGKGLVHGLIATLVLFLAVGVRLARPKPAPPPRRRAFAEHVQAVGALYARARSSPHALSVFARFAEERLRARMPRGTNDVAGFLASRANLPLDVCQGLWARALHAKAGAMPLGDELAVLRDLSAAYAAAMHDNHRVSIGRP